MQWRQHVCRALLHCLLCLRILHLRLPHCLFEVFFGAQTQTTTDRLATCAEHVHQVLRCELPLKQAFSKFGDIHLQDLFFPFYLLKLIHLRISLSPRPVSLGSHLCVLVLPPHILKCLVPDIDSSCTSSSLLDLNLLESVPDLM